MKIARGKCPNYKSILAFSDLHIATGSSLNSLSCQGDLDERFIDDTDLQPMYAIRECTDDEEEEADSETNTDINKKR